MDERRRDYYAGGLMVLIGLIVAYFGSRYNIGTLTHMGPGFFPMCLGVLLAFLGLLIAAAAGRNEAPVTDIVVDQHITSRPDWRGWLCIVVGVIAFIFLAQYAGLLAATFACVFIAALGDRTATLVGSFLLASGVTVFGVVLFYYILHVQLDLMKGW